LGLSFLQDRAASSPVEATEIARLSESQCLATGRDVASFALGILGKPEMYQATAAGRFFDSLLVTMREGAWEWLSAEGSAGWSDPGVIPYCGAASQKHLLKNCA
jgi:hypothetical protein